MEVVCTLDISFVVLLKIMVVEFWKYKNFKQDASLSETYMKPVVSSTWQ
jgi:hypothetical protein